MTTQAQSLSPREWEALRALLHYAETPGDFTPEEARDVLMDAGNILYGKDR